MQEMHALISYGTAYKYFKLLLTFNVTYLFLTLYKFNLQLKFVQVTNIVYNVQWKLKMHTLIDHETKQKITCIRSSHVF